MTVEMKRNIYKTKGHSKVIHLIVALALVLSFSLMTTVPALAAPVVASVTETAFDTATKDHYVNMPATVNAGDLLIVLFSNDGDETVTTPAGWSLLASDANGTQVRLSVYYKIAAGTEGGTTVNFVTSDNEEAAAQVYRITDWHGTTPPEISTAATDTSNKPNPASLDPIGWDVSDTLWLAVAGQDRGDQDGTTAYPAYYTDGISTPSSNGTRSCRTLSARRVLAAASENPGPFTIPVLEEWVAFTIAVRPKPRDLTTSSTEGGSVTEPGEDTFTYDDGTVVDLVAEAEEGYRFVKWTGNVEEIVDIYAAETTITMNGDYSIKANFVAIYDLSINSTEGGSVTEPGEGVFPSYDEETVVDLIAEAEEGYRFVEWTGDVGTIADVHAATTTITMNGDYSITAEFVAIYDLTVSSTEGGSVTEPGEGVFPSYDEGTVVDLIAEAEEGYRFVEWTGDVGTIADVHAATTTITMNGNYSITAEFVAIYDLTVSSTEGGSVTEPGEGVFPSYDKGTVIDLIAEAEEGYRFVEWTGDVDTIADVYAATTTITMNGDYSITANFVEIPSSPVYPTVTTKAATSITTNSTTLNMSYTVGDFSPVQVRFAYKKSTDSAWSYTDWVPKSGSGTYAAPLTGLDSDTTYDFKAQLKYDDTVIEGTTLQLTTDTPSTPPPTGGCFIATAAYGTPTAEQIDVLREFRDIVLLESIAGSQFVALYYQLSPPVADFIAGNELLRTLVREFLIDPIVWVVEATGDIWRN